MLPYRMPYICASIHNPPNPPPANGIGQPSRPGALRSIGLANQPSRAGAVWEHQVPQERLGTGLDPQEPSGALGWPGSPQDREPSGGARGWLANPQRPGAWVGRPTLKTRSTGSVGKLHSTDSQSSRPAVLRSTGLSGQPSRPARGWPPKSQDQEPPGASPDPKRLPAYTGSERFQTSRNSFPRS